MRTVYTNGEYLPENEAHISIFDRGFLFGDAVYEVTAVLNGKLADFQSHMARLQRSLGEIDMLLEVDEKSLLAIHRELVSRNNLTDGLIYLQVSRGATDRDWFFSDETAPITIVAFTQEKSLINIVDDLRWGRADIKTVQLLYSSLMKTRAHQSGADDVWFMRDGMITEGSSNNAYIITHEKEIINKPLSTEILHGITRKSVLKCAKQAGLTLIERAFSVEEAMSAKEAFVTSASAFVMGVVEIDGRTIGNGTPGKITNLLRNIYIEAITEGAI